MPDNQAVKENDSAQVDFLWNDVAAVNDDNCCFIISKAMLELADTTEIIGIVETGIVDIIGEFKNDALNGEIVIEIECESASGEDNFKVTVPFLVDYQGALSRGSVLEENYAHAKLADERHILLETVVSVPKKSMAARSLAKIGHFERKNTIKLPLDLPTAAELIGASLSYQRGEFRADNNQPMVEMLGHIGLIYANATDDGEKIVYYELDEPFALAIEEPLVEAEAGYYALNAQWVNEKEIVLQSFNYLYGQKLADMAVEEKAEEISDDIAPEYQAQTENNSPDESAREAIDAKFKDNLKVARPNRREMLEKHMHRLDKGVKTPHIVRNIEFNK